MKPVKKLISTLLMAGAILPTFAQADNNEALRYAENQLKTTFSNFTVTAFKESKIKGLYEVHASDKLFYYSPESEALIFGQAYSKDGTNLTQLSLQEALQERMESSDIDAMLDTAVVINEGSKLKLIEFSNPDCGYCKAYSKWIKDFEKANSIKVERHIIYSHNAGFPNARAKFEHLICSDDKHQAELDIENAKFSDFKTCNEAKDVFTAHEKASKFFGVQGTPTFLINDSELITGFNTEKLSTYLKGQLND